MEVPKLREKSLHLERALTSKIVGIKLWFLYVAHFCNVINLCLKFLVTSFFTLEVMSQTKILSTIMSFFSYWLDGISEICFMSAYFHLSPLQKHVRKVVGGFRKKSCVSTGVRKPGNTYVSLTTMI